MAGILDQAPPGAPAAAAPAAAPMQAQAPGAQPNLQQALHKIAAAATTVLQDPKILQQLLQLIQSAPTPGQGLAQATALLMKQFAEASKGTMPQAVQIPAAKEVMMIIAKAAQAAGAIPNAAAAVQQAQQFISQAIMKKHNLNPAQIQPAQPHGLAPTFGGP